jgi:hypothetical protein
MVPLKQKYTEDCQDFQPEFLIRNPPAVGNKPIGTMRHQVAFLCGYCYFAITDEENLVSGACRPHTLV